MAKRTPSGVVSSIEDYGKVRIRRFVVVRIDGKCLVSYTILKPNSGQSAVGYRREWDMVCLLDGNELPMGPDPYSNTGWRIERELTPEELERMVCEYHLSLEEAS